MKKNIILMLIFIATTSMVYAGDDKAICFEQLPKKTQIFFNENFSRNEISYIKMDADFLDKDYTIYFTDGTKIDFERNGEWEDIKIGTREIPAKIIPINIKNFLSQKHADAKIIEIEKDSNDREYEVKLNSGIKLKFDLNGKFKYYD